MRVLLSTLITTLQSQAHGLVKEDLPTVQVKQRRLCERGGNQQGQREGRQRTGRSGATGHGADVLGPDDIHQVQDLQSVLACLNKI